jgi:hypothetical protein
MELNRWQRPDVSARCVHGAHSSVRWHLSDSNTPGLLCNSVLCVSASVGWAHGACHPAIQVKSHGSLSLTPFAHFLHALCSTFRHLCSTSCAIVAIQHCNKTGNKPAALMCGVPHTGAQRAARGVA